MTEKRFISIGGSLYDTTKAITDGECMGVFIDRSECENVCDLLNEKEERIETLKEDVETILDYVLHKGKFAMSVKEQKAHNRLRDFVRGDVE